jgi:hypothetical protein
MSAARGLNSFVKPCAYGGFMCRAGTIGIFGAAVIFAAGTVGVGVIRAQSDPQAGAQLGEQSALGGKQGQGANTQKATEKSPSGETSLAAGTTLRAELSNSLDSKKVKQGEAVNARTTQTLKSTDDRIILPKGTKLVGHVTQASAGQADSTLGVVFEKATLKNGQELALNLAIQALAPPASSGAEVNQTADIAPAGGMREGRGTAPGAAGNAGSVASTTAGTATGTSTTGGVAGNAAAADQLNANSRGVVGLNNLTLSTAGGSSAQGSVITSSGKNVHLDSGTRLILVSQASAN